jgi:hypothetical protein
VVVDPSLAQKGTGGAKPAVAVADVDPSAAGGGGAAPATKTPGLASQSGRFSGVALDVGAGVLSLGLGWLAAELKKRADDKAATQQFNAFLALAKNKINQNPEKALKQMMIDPGRQIYAWVYLTNSMITSFQADAASVEPSTSSSPPLLDMAGIDYQPAPVPPELGNTFSGISTGASHFTMTSVIIIDIPLKTPPIEDMIDYAIAHKLPLDDLYMYALNRVIGASHDLEGAIIAHRDAQMRTFDNRDPQRSESLKKAESYWAQNEQKVMQASSYWQQIADRIKQAMPPI